jgi:hypothetical protein
MLARKNTLCLGRLSYKVETNIQSLLALFKLKYKLDDRLGWFSLCNLSSLNLIYLLCLSDTEEKVRV